MFQGNYSNAVFVDESSFNLDIRRSQVRSRRDTRAVVKIPTIRGKPISLISSIGANDILFFKIIYNTIVSDDIFSEYLLDLCNYLRNVCNMENS